MRSPTGLRALHTAARVAFCLLPPLRAKAVVDRLGRSLPSLEGVDDARWAVAALWPRGSCLTRAVTVAATAPGAEVVIGVDHSRVTATSAHAWLELGGVPINTSLGDGEGFPAELARLPMAGARLAWSKSSKLKWLVSLGGAGRRES